MDHWKNDYLQFARMINALIATLSEGETDGHAVLNGDDCAAALAAVRAWWQYQFPTPRELEYAAHVRHELRFNDDIEIDSDVAISMGPSVDASGENGAWVRTWRWVSREELVDEGVACAR